MRRTLTWKAAVAGGAVLGAGFGSVALAGADDPSPAVGGVELREIDRQLASPGAPLSVLPAPVRAVDADSSVTSPASVPAATAQSVPSAPSVQSAVSVPSVQSAPSVRSAPSPAPVAPVQAPAPAPVAEDSPASPASAPAAPAPAPVADDSPASPASPASVGSIDS